MGFDSGYEYRIGDNGETIYIHRETMEIKLGRKLSSDEIVHQKDEIKSNNDPDNLELTNRSDHGKIHCDPKRMSEISLLAKRNPLLGSKRPNSKLNEDKVRRIKELLNDGQSQSAIGRLYDVDRTIIREIKFNRSWKHVK